MPIPDSAPRIGSLERAILEHLLEATGQPDTGATVRDIYSRLAGERDIAYTTVLTVLDRLAKKELVTRTRVGRAWCYRLADSPGALVSRTLRSALEMLDPADRGEALALFAQTFSPQERADLRQALDRLDAAAEG